MRVRLSRNICPQSCSLLLPANLLAVLLGLLVMGLT